MCVLTALVGINYIIICRHYPDGGGVYASVRHRSEVISIVGAFLLVADYLVTAAFSSLSAFQYLGVPHPEQFAALAILVIGALNYFGPRHTGGLAFLIAVPAVFAVVLLGAFSLSHLGAAIHNLQPLSGTFSQNWSGFVGIVLALSGVEAVANATGVMKLNPGSSAEKPSVSRTSTPAIIVVMVEVCLFTALLGLAMHALGGLQAKDGDVDAPGHPGVRDYMLRYMAQVFVGHSLGATMGHIAAWLISLVMAGLLLSAVNTAVVDLIAIQFLMSRDRELPSIFQKLNKFGVPGAGMIVATIIPMFLVILVKDMAGLADLYAIAVVGAIAANLGSTSTDRKIGLAGWERSLMFGRPLRHWCRRRHRRQPRLDIDRQKDRARRGGAQPHVWQTSTPLVSAAPSPPTSARHRPTERSGSPGGSAASCLADLYAIGVVGAIAANLGSTSTDRKIGLAGWERSLMFGRPLRHWCRRRHRRQPR